jgi:curved DNA-binding protein CbpA
VVDRERNYYSVLGVGRDASAVEIDRAYRRAARATHPDTNPGDSSAAERFNAVNTAYETLRRPAKRATYDRARAAAARPVPVTVVRRPPAGVAAPVRLGRRRPPQAEPLTDELFTLLAALSRLLG